MEHKSEEEAGDRDDRGHESSASSRLETPTKRGDVHLPTPVRRPRRRVESRTDSETSSQLNEIVDVVRDSANQLVGVLTNTL